ncbi:MAG: diphthine synthase [Thaumarchaeota archaeon]|nr:diphthine synthase [Nitrososphaerota archaeon]
MLLLVGLGIHGYAGLSAKALDLLLSIKEIYVEKYTSPMPESEIDGLKRVLNKDVKVVPRWFVEDGREILQLAKNIDVALLVYGDPLIATTHLDLRVRAEKGSIKTKVLHASSSITSIIGECGLHIYKIGKIITLTSERSSVTNTYYAVYNNLLSGSHTLILLEYNQDKNLFLKPNEALKMLLESEKDEKHEIFSDETFAIVASRVGTDDQSIVSGKIMSLLEKDFGEPPHSVVVPSNLHFTETDALAVLTKLLDAPTDNSKNVKKVADQMIAKYVPKARKALEQARNLVNNDKSFSDIFENAEYYISDAEKFLREGKPELAVLSIGYAEGLIDAIRFLKGVNIWE